jgi:arylmalonate decarboxylase
VLIFQDLSLFSAPLFLKSFMSHAMPHTIEKMSAEGAKSAARDDERSGLAKALSLYSAYGWRGRIGLIAPSTNTTLEPEFYRMCPEGIAIHASRVYQAGRQEPSSYHLMAEDIGTAATLLATSEVGVVAFGCTSCTYFVPPDAVRTTMREKAGCHPVLTADAVLEAMRAMNLKRIAVVGPRTEFVTEKEIAFLTEEGFEIVASRCLGLGATEEERRSIGRVPPEVVHQLAVSVDSADVEAIFVSCTQLPTLRVIEPIERALRKPVITSNQATMWRCLRALKFSESVPGFGRLLFENPPLS